MRGMNLIDRVLQDTMAGGVKVINAADERMPTEEDILLEKFSKLEI